MAWKVASRRVTPNFALLNADGVFAGAGKVPGSSRDHIPITGCALLVDGVEDSSKAVTSTDSVRSARPENQK